MTFNADDSLRRWLILIRAPGLGPLRLRRALASLGIQDPRRLLDLSGARLARAGLPGKTIDALRNPSEAWIDADLDWLSHAGHRLLPFTHADSPPALLQVPDPPLGLFSVGDASLLQTPQFAIVGSRNPTPAGQRFARGMARALAARGLGITSGLAAGIDAGSHRGALDVDGITLAVLGNGPDRVYPTANRDLARDIAREGVLVSEFPPGTPPRREHFPRRNRIIAGLCLGTLVVEAAAQSGSLITAHLAADYGREVFAVPGSVNNPLARGCHRLLREGATLVESPEDVLEELPLADLGAVAPSIRPGPAVSPDFARSPQMELETEHRNLLAAMGFDPVAVDSLVARTRLTAEEVSSMLLILELQGHVETLPGGRYARTDPPALA
ncbi:MAG: DNA-processing protein DprA [Pseudomonadota bacterium]